MARRRRALTAEQLKCLCPARPGGVSAALHVSERTVR